MSSSASSYGRSTSSLGVNGHGRPGSSASQQTATRPYSSLSHGSTASARQPALPQKTPSAARYGGLAERDLQKITSSIRTANKTTGGTGTYARPSQKAVMSSNRVIEEDEYEAGSFVAETSFTRAPLNSRLPPVSPHRKVIKGKKARAPASSDDDEEDGPDPDSSSQDGREEALQKEVRKQREGLDKDSLDGLPVELQEALIVEDLLFVLMGIEGQYIEFDDSYSPEDDFDRLQGAVYKIDPLLERAVAASVERFLPLATYYTSINAFIEQYSLLELGVINHALCAAIREELATYRALLCQLEQQFLSSSTFSLQKMWFYVQPAMHTFSLIERLIVDLVSISIANQDESGSGDDDDDSDLGLANEGLRGVLDEMRKATAQVGNGDAWQGGPAKGGEVLAIVYDKLQSMSGDPKARELYETLFVKASQPYATILLEWVTTGQLHDPWDEFIVKESKGIDRGSLDHDYTDEYWERRYTLRDRGAKVVKPGSNKPRDRGLSGGAVVPAFLDKWKTKVLLAGKYLNVIRECGIKVEVPEGAAAAADELLVLDSDGFYRRIEAAYTYANKTLLKLLLEEKQLVARLKSLKQYFFMDHGDAFTHFLDLAKVELARKKKNASVTKLQSLLDLALRAPASTPAADPYKDDVKVALGSSTLTDWLVKIVNVSGALNDQAGSNATEQGYLDGRNSAMGDHHQSDDKDKASSSATLYAHEAFMLDYSVKFPVSLVISRKTILRYQLLFRHLLQLRYAERALSDTWSEHVKQPAWRTRSRDASVEQWKGRVFALRSRMLAFVQQMYAFCVSEVLEPHWRALESKLDQVETVDQLLKDHVDFLDTCLKECLLTNEKLLVLNSKLLTVCMLFASYTGSFTKFLIALEEAESKGTLPPSLEKQWDFLSKFEINFNHHTKSNLERIQYTASRENATLIPLVARLNPLRAVVPGQQQS